MLYAGIKLKYGASLQIFSYLLSIFISGSARCHTIKKIKNCLKRHFIYWMRKKIINPMLLLLMSNLTGKKIIIFYFLFLIKEPHNYYRLEFYES